MPPVELTTEWIVRRRIDFGSEADTPSSVEKEGTLLANLAFDWPDNLAPTPIAMEEAPAEDAPLPEVDYVVITWTAAEADALADTLTPGVSRKKWYRYERYFNEYLPDIRSTAPARTAKRLGSYYLTTIGEKRVLCFKSELHMNQDGVEREPGNATLPVKRLFEQIIKECAPKLVITVGTAGATYPEHFLGDVMITRAAKFRLTKEFRNASFNGQTYTCDFEIPTNYFAAARKLIRKQDRYLVEPDFGPPTGRYDWPGALLPGTRNKADLRVDGVDLPAFQPILTTDYFEFGTTTNRLWEEGCGVEMGDAVLGLAAQEMGDAAPRWLVIRNASDPTINGALPTEPRTLNMQAHWAVWYYEAFGYWTSVNSAIATWAIIAGDG